MEKHVQGDWMSTTVKIFSHSTIPPISFWNHSSLYDLWHALKGRCTALNKNNTFVFALSFDPLHINFISSMAHSCSFVTPNYFLILIVKDFPMVCNDDLFCNCGTCLNPCRLWQRTWCSLYDEKARRVWWTKREDYLYSSHLMLKDKHLAEPSCI